MSTTITIDLEKFASALSSFGRSVMLLGESIAQQEPAQAMGSVSYGDSDSSTEAEPENCANPFTSVVYGGPVEPEAPCDAALGKPVGCIEPDKTMFDLWPSRTPLPPKTSEEQADRARKAAEKAMDDAKDGKVVDTYPQQEPVRNNMTALSGAQFDFLKSCLTPAEAANVETLITDRKIDGLSDDRMASLNNAFRKMRHRSRRAAFSEFYGQLEDKTFFDMATKAVWNYNYDKARRQKEAEEAGSQAVAETSDEQPDAVDDVPEEQPVAEELPAQGSVIPSDKSDEEKADEAARKAESGLDRLRRLNDKVNRAASDKKSLEERYDLPRKAAGRDVADSQWASRLDQYHGREVGELEWRKVGDLMSLEGRLVRIERLCDLGFAMVSMNGTRYCRIVGVGRLNGLVEVPVEQPGPVTLKTVGKACYGVTSEGPVVYFRPVKVTALRKSGMASVEFTDDNTIGDIQSACIFMQE